MGVGVRTTTQHNAKQHHGALGGKGTVTQHQKIEHNTTQHNTTQLNTTQHHNTAQHHGLNNKRSRKIKPHSPHSIH